MERLLAEGRTMTDYILTGLVKRRAEIAGEIDATQEKLRALIRDLEHLDATLLIFDPQTQIAAIKPRTFRPREDWSHRGQMTRLIINVLRQTAEPMTTRDIAVQIMVERALDQDDIRLVRLMSKRVGVALRHMRDKDRSSVVATQGPGQ
jgi:hypothetical protein